MVFIQLKSEADLAKLIDLVKRNADKVGQSVYDASARWEQMYFGDDQEEVIHTFTPPPEPVTFTPPPEPVFQVRTARIACTNMLKR